MKSVELHSAQSQLEEVSKTISNLERLKVQVPEELVKLQAALLRKVDDAQEFQSTLRSLDEELGKIQTKIRGCTRSVFTQASLGTRRRRRRSNEETIPTEVLRDQIFRALEHFGGGAKAARALDWIEESLKDQLTPSDLVMTATKQPSWRSRACLERKKMAKEGILKPAAGFGNWQLTEVRHLEGLIDSEVEVTF